MPSTLGHLAALEAIKLLTGYTQSDLAGRFLIQNLVTLETTRHTVVRMPWCDVCGGERGSGMPFGGGQDASPPIDEIDDPDALRSALEGWVDERTGIVQRLVVNQPDIRDPQLPVTATAVPARYTEGTLPLGSPEGGSGKGLTAAEAMRGAVGEALERYSASRIDHHACRRASAEDLDGDVLAPTALSLYDDEQYRQHGFPFVPWKPDRPIDWVRGRWLHSAEPVWVPALPVYFNYPAPPGERFCQVTSSGLAAGRDPDDATLRATLELLERDAFMLTWLCRRPGWRVVVDGSIDASIREVIRQLEEVGAHIELYLLDSGVDVPTIVCLALGDGRDWPGVTVSLSAHLSPRRAVRQAVLEQGHVGPYIRRVARSGEQHIPRSPDEVVNLMDHALYYVPVERLNAFDFLRVGETDSVVLSDLTEPDDVSLGALVGRLEDARLRIAAVDVTSPDVARGPFRVARALGENVQPIDFGYRFRRLNNPRLRDLAISGINPFPHPLA
jgi:ribosomal protein S12 methylthiotransferase accessory factor